MAEVLVCAHDRPTYDSGGRWYRGMPVVVMPDKHPWGKKEGLPKFVILKFPRLTVEEAKEVFLGHDFELVDEMDDEKGEVIEKRKMYARVKNTIPEARMVSTIAAGGVVTIRKLKAAVETGERVPVVRKGEPIERETSASIRRRSAAARAQARADAVARGILNGD